MTDIKPHIQAKSDQLNADDLMGSSLTIKITNVSAGSAEQPIIINYEGDNGRPWKPCKSMLRVLSNCWSTDGKSYIGKSLTLYRDPDVVFAGIKVGGVRISHMSDIKGEQVMALTARRGAKATFKVKPLASAATASPELIKAGDAAASKGSDAYKMWLDGLGDDKPLVKPHHSKWSKIATEKDNEDDDTPVL